MSTLLPRCFTFLDVFFCVTWSGGQAVGERGPGGSDLSARDGTVPRALPTIPDQGPRQAGSVQAGEMHRSRSCRSSVWFGFGFPPLGLPCVLLVLLMVVILALLVLVMVLVLVGLAVVVILLVLALLLVVVLLWLVVLLLPFPLMSTLLLRLLYTRELHPIVPCILFFLEAHGHTCIFALSIHLFVRLCV